MENTIDKVRTKKLGVLELLNNCRIKLSGLFSLINTSVINAKQYSQDMGIVNTKVSGLYDDLKGITIATTTSNKEDRPKNLRASKPVVKKINVEIKELTTEFWDLVEKFNSAIDKNYTELRTQYKSDVVACCQAYKTINDSGENSKAIDKGYRQQVKLIKHILDKINSVVAEYKDEREKVENIKTDFNRTLNFASTLSDKLIEA